MRGKRSSASGSGQTPPKRRNAKRPSTRSARSPLEVAWDHSDQGVRIIDARGVIIDVNQTYCRMVSRAKETLIGIPFVEVYSPQIRTTIMDRFLEHVAAGTLEPPREQRVHLWDGREVWLEASDSRIQKEGEEPQVLTIFRDITSARLLSERLIELRQLESIREAQTMYISGAEPRTVFGSLLHILVQLTGSTSGILHEVRADHDTLLEYVPLARTGPVWEEPSLPLPAGPTESTDQGGLPDEVARTGQVLIINTTDVRGDPRLEVFRSALPRLDSYLGIPLLFGGELVGVASVANCPDGYSEALATSLSPFSSTCAAIIHAVKNSRKEAAYVSALRAREESLQKSEHKIKSIFRAAPAGIGHTVNRVFVDVNDHLCLMTGYGRQEMVGKSARMLYPTQEDYDYVGRVKYAQIAATGTGTVTTRWQRKDGQRIDVLLSSTAINPDDQLNGVTFTAWDITEQRRAEEAVRTSEERYRMVVEASQDAIFLIDMDGHFTFCNSCTAAMFGYERPEDLIGLSGFDCIVPEDRQAARELFASLPPRGTIKGATVRVLRKDAATFPAEFSAALVPNENGSATRAMCVVRDITERVEAEEQLRSSLREKEVLLKEIHHRVKNNLQVISSLLSLQAGGIQDPVTREMFRESQNRVRSMAMVHERLYRAENLTEADFGEYVRAVTSHLVRSYGKPGVFCHVEARGIFLSIDLAIPCGLIVNELVSNALKHAFPGGTGGTIRLAIARQPSGMLKLSVSDDGVGFPGHLDWRNSGSMGMTLINNLSAQLGGTLALATGNGTEFQLEFPLTS